MKIQLDYDKSSVDFELLDDQVKEILESNVVELPKGTPEDHVNWAIDNPIGTDAFESLFKAGETVCIVISDTTRKWQCPSVAVPILVERLNALGVADEDIVILSAAGTHRAQTKEEHISLVSEEIYNRVKVVDHCCTDDDSLTYMGETSFGTPVYLNSIAVNSDKVILVGGCVYHFLAGFGGGRKNVVPGIAGRETIMKNHSLALNPGLGNGSNPNVRSGVMNELNPFHCDLVEAAKMLDPVFIVNVVVDSDYKVIKAFAGDMIEAHKGAADLVDAIDGVYIQKKYPFVVATAGAFPKDINLYQGSKTLCNIKECVEDGGTAIMLDMCREGVGDPDCARLITDYTTMVEREEALRADFSIGAYVGYLYCEMAEKINLILVSDLPKEMFKTTKIHAVSTMEEAMELAKQLNGGSIDQMEACLLPHGANTFPKLK